MAKKRKNRRVGAASVGTAPTLYDFVRFLSTIDCIASLVSPGAPNCSFSKKLEKTAMSDAAQKFHQA
jgi:hypothetical protein